MKNALVLGVLVAGCSGPKLSGDAGIAGPQPSLVFVSLIQLIAGPERFDGREVAVAGYCWVEPEEGTALYLHEEDHRYFATMNSVGLTFEQSLTNAGGCHDRHVLIFGIFAALRGTGTVSGSVNVGNFRVQEPVSAEGNGAQ